MCGYLASVKSGSEFDLTCAREPSSTADIRTYADSGLQRGKDAEEREGAVEQRRQLPCRPQAQVFGHRADALGTKTIKN